MDPPERGLAVPATGSPPPASAGISGGGLPPSKGRKRLGWASPGLVALLWAAATALVIANVVLFPADPGLWVSSTLYLSGVAIFSGLLAAWVLRLGRSTFHLLSTLTAVALVASLASLLLKLAAPAAVDQTIDEAVRGVSLLATGLVVRLGYGAGLSRTRRLAATLLALGVIVGGGALSTMDDAFWRLSASVQPLLGRRKPVAQADNQPVMAEDILWAAQPGLIEQQRGAIRPSVAGQTTIYAMAVAGSGVQALFAREAREALRVAVSRFGGASGGGVLLSNGAADFLHAPLATRANIAAAAQAIGEKANPKRDLLFVYIASHGGQNAELESDLPGYRPLQTISSATTADALRQAGVARRVIVVSACFSASWIPALADDNTIVITAAAKDRTSFGCDDTRRLTVFGEAFLGSLAAKDASLRDVFEDAKRKISLEEQKEGVTPSQPQVFVGRNMQTLWLGQGNRATQPPGG